MLYLSRIFTRLRDYLWETTVIEMIPSEILTWYIHSLSDPDRIQIARTLIIQPENISRVPYRPIFRKSIKGLLEIEKVIRH